MAESVTKSKASKGKKAKGKRHSLAYTPTINQRLHDESLKASFKEKFSERLIFSEDSGVELHVDPFSVGIIPNLIQDEKFLQDLRDELLDLIFYEKNNDLYKFQQTDDFKKINKPHASAVRQLLKEQLLPWLRDVTGIPLNDKIDITCSRYDYTDTLLCHDDELDTRRIAFVLYLVPPWKPEDGGALDLYNMDEHLQPKHVVKSILPKWNQLVWFEVTEASHHQVSEVLSKDKCRLSVNGWFHSPPIPRAPRYVEPREPLQQHNEFDECLFSQWINPIFLDPLVQSDIQEKFENDSEIELQDFLQEEKYTALKEAFESGAVSWQDRGPPNKRQFHRAIISAQVPQIIRECLALLQSELFFLTLSNLTGLKLHPLAVDNDDTDEDEEECQTSQSCFSSSTTISGGTSSTVDEVSSTNCMDIEGQEKETLVRSESSGDKRTSQNSLNKNDDASQAKENTSSKKRRLNSDATVHDKNAEVSSSKCRVEVRRWQHGDYTLLHDTDSEGAKYALDLMLYCSCPGWKQESGGYTSYIAKGEDEELLTVMPAENSLALVYRDKETLRFVKHINSRVTEEQHCRHFYEFSGVYFE